MSTQKIVPRRNKTVHASYDASITYINSISIEIGEVVSSRYNASPTKIETIVVIGKESGYDFIHKPDAEQELDWVEY